MTTLQWDETGERVFEAGVDRGVLYLTDGSGVAWNGLLGVTEKVSGSSQDALYFEGVKYGDHVAIGDFAASLKAYTYPDEFLEFEGLDDVGNGLLVTGQPSGRFGLSYRTKIGNDVEGIDLGYKIHILYNLTATPSDKNYATLTGADAIEFEWALTAIPGEIPGYRPTAHLILDSRKMNSLLLSDIEDTLYGTDGTEPRLPSISTLVNFIDSWVIIRITDNFDGTWTAEGPDEYITMLEEDLFQITQANAVYLDPFTYRISSKSF